MTMRLGEKGWGREATLKATGKPRYSIADSPTSWLQPLTSAGWYTVLAIAGPAEPRQCVCLLLMLAGFSHFPTVKAAFVSGVGRASRGTHL